MENIATITSKGQMTIPKDIRKALDLQPKDRMLFVLHGDRIEMIPLRMRPLSELFGVLAVDEQEFSPGPGTAELQSWLEEYRSRQ